MFACCTPSLKQLQLTESLLQFENFHAWKPSLETSAMNSDDVSTSLESGPRDDDEDSTCLERNIDSPRSEASKRSWGCDSLVEICSLCPVPSVAKAGPLELKQTRSYLSILPRSCKRFFVVRDGCLEVWSTEKDHDKDSSNREIIPLRDLKDMDQQGNRLSIKFLQPKPTGPRIGLSRKPQERLIELCAESESDAGDWFEAIEFVLRSMSMPINYSLCETPVFQPDILQGFQRLVDHCYVSKATRDRRGENLPKKLKVVKVIKVQNSTLLREYNHMRCQIADELKDIDRQQSLDVLSPDVRTSLLNPPLQTLPQLDDATIERWLFHGTNPRGLEGIAKSNFDLSRAGSGAGRMYGAGIYCAGCSSKADEYTQADADGLRGLLLCRATLGKILYTAAVNPNVTQLEEQKKRQQCHTILGDRWTAAGTYREFVFGQKEQLYPEFIIYYQREYESRD
jgi:hypothetical protein